jgi:PAS domain S-box-containing protein
MTAFFRNLRIRSKLLGGYTLIFIVATLLGGAGTYFQVKSTIETNIENDLKNSTATILNMIETAASTSIKNHLRAVAENNKQIITTIYKDFQQGLITEKAAKSLAKKLLLSQTIGKTGYIYCVKSDGEAPIHPNPGVAGKNFIDTWFIKDMIRMKDGYLEYDWKNPGEDHEKPKALYMSYFEPWDWIISVSSYREEFKELVNVHDFRDSILALSFGKTGYAYVIDSKGTLIVHPTLSGNYYNAQGKDGHFFIRDICRLKNGKLIYSWKNPDDQYYRDKIVLFNYIPEYDWIVACSSYLDEMYAPLKTIRNIILLTACLILALVLVSSLWVNSTILLPLRHLMNRFSLGASGDLTVRMPVTSEDEIGQLAAFFNKFMGTLEIYHTNLNTENHKQELMANALRISEEKYRNILERMEEGYFEVDLDGRFTFFNRSMLDILGLEKNELNGMNIRAWASKGNSDQIDRVFQQVLKTGKAIKTSDLALVKKDKNICEVETSVSLIKEKDTPPKGFCGVVRDVSQRKKSERALRLMEREILNISERERQKIAMDLHDDLCPQLIGIEVMTKILVEKLAEKSMDEILDAERIRQLILDTISKTRQLSRGLSPVNLSEYGFGMILEELATYVKEVFNINCQLNLKGTGAIKENSAATHIYYIAHEAVHNAARHSRAKNIVIDLTIDDEKITLSVSDDGNGLDNSQESRGLGLKIMSYRAQRIGASLDILENENGGTLVRLDTQP